jgi:hypothetical protein
MLSIQPIAYAPADFFVSNKMNMNVKYKIILILLILLVPSLLFAECVNYEPDLVSLNGKIIRKTFPGPPNYENIKTGDQPETYWILILTTPLCVNAKTGDSLYAS